MLSITEIKKMKKLNIEKIKNKTTKLILLLVKSLKEDKRSKC